MYEMADSKEASGSYTVNSTTEETTPISHNQRSKIRSNNWSSGVFRVSVILTEIVGLLCLCLVAIWTTDYMDGKGFAWSRDHIKQFKYHPLFMVVGLVFLYGNAIMIYRIFADVEKFTLKVIHAVLHGGAFIFTVIALVAVFQYHYYMAYPDLYSLHSWIGLLTVIFFALQYVIGFIVYLLPVTPMEWRKKLMPFHIFFGILLFVSSIGACITGMTEKLIFAGRYSDLEKGSVIANCLAIALIVFSTLVIFIATASQFKRMPAPEEMNLSTSLQEERKKPDRTSL